MKKIAKVLLVRTTNRKTMIPPLGLLYIAGAVKEWSRKNKCEIKILDFMADAGEEGVFTRCLKDFAPDIIGFSSLDCEYPEFKALAMLSRESVPQSVIISGGPLSSNYYKEILKNKLADFTVIGEGEITITELLDALTMETSPEFVAGLAFIKDGSIFETGARELIADLDKVAFPAWDLIDIKRYAAYPNWNGMVWEKSYAPILTSRGCSYYCIYCHNLFGKKVRARSVDNLLSEIILLYNDYGIREFHIIDDFFNFDIERLKIICKAIIAKKLKIKISFPNALRVDRMDKEAVTLLKKAGAYKINYAIETASPRLQKLIRKNLDLDKAREIIDFTSKEGIICFGYFMMGFPTETVKEIKQTISFAVKSRLDSAKFFKVVAHKNTELARCVAQKYPVEHFNNGEDVDYYGWLTNFSDIPSETLNNLILNAHFKFYSKCSRIFRIVTKYKNHFGAFVNIIKMLSIAVISGFSDQKEDLSFKINS